MVETIIVFSAMLLITLCAIVREYTMQKERVALLRHIDDLHKKLMARDLTEYWSITKETKGYIKNPNMDRLKERLRERSYLEITSYESTVEGGNEND